MISLLLPSRKRKFEFKRFYESAFDTAKYPDQVEVVARFDNDDWKSAKVARDLGARVLSGPRIPEMTRYWNECFSAAKGDIVCQANDDVVFRTHDWDDWVEDEFTQYPDHILMVFGSDRWAHAGKFGPHPFVHRRWVEVLGYFIPPYFVSDFGDAWVNELAANINRRVYIPFIMEHLHFSTDHAEKDETTNERLERHAKFNPDAVWAKTTAERAVDTEKLRTEIKRYAEEKK